MNKLQRSLPDGNVGILEAFHDGRSVALDGGRIQLHHLAQGVERDIPDVVVLVAEESAQETEDVQTITQLQPKNVSQSTINTW